MSGASGRHRDKVSRRRRSDRRQVGIEGSAQTAKQVWRRIFKVAILAPAEAVAGHLNVAAKMLLVTVEGGSVPTFLSREQFFDDRTAIL